MYGIIKCKRQLKLFSYLNLWAFLLNSLSLQTVAIIATIKK